MIPVSDNIYAFKPIGLADMDRVTLMDRTDTKFMFRGELLTAMLDELCRNYSMLEIDTIRRQQYVSLYFDNEIFKFYFDHHNGRMNRYKVRYRKYAGSRLHFLEVKFKNNRGLTRKKRMEIDAGSYNNSCISDEQESFIMKRMTFNPGVLSPVLFVEYERLALVHKEFSERVTIDINLRYIMGEKVVDIENVVLAEVKQDRISRSSDFIRLMRKMRISEAQFSKYCFGVNMLYSNLKHNNFKPRILNYKKIAYGK